ncbi:MAG: rRNA pseudouridine synthase [Leptospiraceae bacterium]|nr:rRNA pseudouridine synthase [Leptospiraceae bacterium]
MHNKSLEMILESDSMRINRYLARCGLGSRRKVEELIRNGLILVNDQVCTDLSRRIVPADRVLFEGQRLALPDTYRYLAFHKPVDVIVSRRTGQAEKSVFDFFGDTSRGLVYAGRLDKMSRGLLILSDDGSFIHQLTHPGHKVPRHYRLQVHSESALDVEHVSRCFIEGIEDQGELLQASQMRITTLDTESPFSYRYTIDVTLHTGRKRQLRRMCQLCNLEVLDLFRYGIGDLRLAELNLASGQWCALQRDELDKLSVL